MVKSYDIINIVLQDKEVSEDTVDKMKNICLVVDSILMLHEGIAVECSIEKDDAIHIILTADEDDSDIQILDSNMIKSVAESAGELSIKSDDNGGIIIDIAV